MSFLLQESWGNKGEINPIRLRWLQLNKSVPEEIFKILILAARENLSIALNLFQKSSLET